jgi:membrane associated rhomboid family serine protease
MESIVRDIKREFTQGNKITRLIIINIFVFVLLGLFKVFFRFAGSVEGGWFMTIKRYITMSDSLIFDITHPWVFITSIFVHFSMWHLLWNMLFLYWFGKIVGDLAGDKHVYPLYFYGGILGGVAFLLTANLLGYVDGGNTFAYGASGAVMAFVIAAATLSPDYMMHLILIGAVRLKYIALAVLIMDVLALGSDINTGGHFAHLGGAFMGWFYVYALRNGINLVPDWLKVTVEKKPTRNYPRRGTKVETVIRSIKTPKKRAGKKSDVKNKPNNQSEVDRILDKINKTGIDSLTDIEKETLYRASNKK